MPLLFGGFGSPHVVSYTKIIKPADCFQSAGLRNLILPVIPS
jgi:hypothetical protein